MKNITVRVDDVTYRQARIRAAEAGTSVSAMVRDFLTSRVNETERLEKARIDSLRALYRKAESRSRRRSKPLRPMTRDEIYDERVR
jgi:plasmid stability protein